MHTHIRKEREKKINFLSIHSFFRFIMLFLSRGGLCVSKNDSNWKKTTRFLCKNSISINVLLWLQCTRWNKNGERMRFYANICHQTNSSKLHTVKWRKIKNPEVSMMIKISTGSEWKVTIHDSINMLEGNLKTKKVRIDFSQQDFLYFLERFQLSMI